MGGSVPLPNGLSIVLTDELEMPNQKYSIDMLDLYYNYENMSIDIITDKKFWRHSLFINNLLGYYIQDDYIKKYMTDTYFNSPLNMLISTTTKDFIISAPNLQLSSIHIENQEEQIIKFVNFLKDWYFPLHTKLYLRANTFFFLTHMTIEFTYRDNIQ